MGGGHAASGKMSRCVMTVHRPVAEVRRWLKACMLAALVAGPVWACAAAEKLPDGAKVIRLEVQPGEVELSHRFAYRQLLLTAVLESGERLDATRMAKVEVSAPMVEVSPTAMVRPVKDGEGTIKLTLGKQSVEIPVHVKNQSAAYKASFVRDVMPTLSKMGCNAGTCHGAAKGKNGFKLSLRGYDPLFDHRALTDDMAGRRFNRSAPEQSLMLLKPSGGVPHVGGVLTHPGEPYYEVLKAWIADGVQIDLDSPRVVKIELSPKNPQIPLPGMKQQMVVLATYSDGAQRDVTSEAFVESSLTETAEVDKRGLVTAVRRGEAAMLARYEGRYDATALVVMGDRHGFVWRDQPANNFVDELAYVKMKRLKIQPSDLCTDAEFIRRVYLDLTGLPPGVDEVRSFLTDERSAKVKRDELIEQLTNSPEFIEHWTSKWCDLLQVNRKFLSVKGAWAWRRWIRDAVANDTPYDRFAYAILTGSGSTYQNPPAGYMRVLRDPRDAMENSTQLFLGVRFSCNKCHDHPFERWTQNQYYDLAAYFAQVGRKPGLVPGDEVIYDTRGTGEVTHPKTGKVSKPAFPYDYPGMPAAEGTRREQFARWATSAKNPYFATSYVNRVWSYLLGVGLIDPADDIRAGNPPSNPELLDRLTRDFIDYGFSFRHLVRTICGSRVYQLSIATNVWNADDQINFSHAVARRLPAETLFDTIQAVTGAHAKLPGVPAGFRAAELPDSAVKVQGGFLDLFGRPARESSCECERAGGVMLGQTLNMVNGPTVAEALAAPNNRIAQLVEHLDDDASLVDSLFLAVLSRPATPGEVATGMAAIHSAESRLVGAQDLCWALINSPSFLFNH